MAVIRYMASLAEMLMIVVSYGLKDSVHDIIFM